MFVCLCFLFSINCTMKSNYKHSWKLLPKNELIFHATLQDFQTFFIDKRICYNGNGNMAFNLKNSLKWFLLLKGSKILRSFIQIWQVLFTLFQCANPWLIFKILDTIQRRKTKWAEIICHSKYWQNPKTSWEEHSSPV